MVLKKFLDSIIFFFNIQNNNKNKNEFINNDELQPFDKHHEILFEMKPNTREYRYLKYIVLNKKNNICNVPKCENKLNINKGVYKAYDANYCCFYCQQKAYRILNKYW